MSPVEGECPQQRESVPSREDEIHEDPEAEDSTELGGKAHRNPKWEPQVRQGVGC